MKKVLVIDDTPEVRDIVAAMLDSAGFRTVSAGDGRSGVSLARLENPDLIICDIRMPGFDGYEVLADLRRDPATATIPFVFLSGVTERAGMRQGMDLGADDFLTKPFTFDELLAAVNSRLKKQEVVNSISEQKLESLRENISFSLPHELLTPLNGILGLSSMMVQDYETLTPKEVFEFARNIHESGQRLNRLIENFLTYSKLELIAADPEKVAALRAGSRVHTEEILREVSQRLAEAHRRAGEVLVIAEDALLPLDPDHFRKIFEELLDNALKFSNPGSPVRVVGRKESAGYRLEISDRGRGLTAEQIGKIGAHMQFDRKAQEQQGAGLGLAIARRLAELYGGKKNIRSVVGEGTTVEVVFPLAS
ncbi:MAG: hybrid sensor histidine kinase/response regulator [Verrucomicrobia bacterium]|nr:hybrid sensor histidine kinase/response regulator [Verrucomicrobiota bacterium]